VFCPNCGTQNPDTAQTCSKCSFHLKGAAAPKFKGTMLMMNQPVVPTTGAPPPAAGAPPPAAGAPPGASLPGGAPRPSASPPGAGNVPSKLKGTMVGVAPMGAFGGMGGMGVPPGPSAPAPGMGAPAMGAPPPAAPPAPFPEQSSAFSPPVPQPGVNPLGGTVAADAGSFASAFGPGQQGGYAPPPAAAPQPYGGPPAGGASGFAPTAAVPATGGWGPPPGAYGQQPGPGTGPQPAYGAPPPNAYGGPPPGAPQGAPPGVGAGAYGNTPPPGQGYGAPPGQQQGYGAAPPGYGQPPAAGYAGPPPGFGPPPGYPQAPGAGYGAPQAPAGYGGAPAYGQAMQQAGAPLAPNPYAGPGAMVGTLNSAGTNGPTRRNALMTMLLPYGVMVGGNILGTILALAISPSLSIIGSLASLGGFVWLVLLTIPMVNELKAVTQNANLPWWPIIVPFYNWYWMWILIPGEVVKAKQILGVQTPARNIVLYIFLFPFALASDLNDMVR
jgi:hypothetical protein